MVNDIAETSISGTKSSYPPVISAIKNMAVSGACSTPLITPHMATKVKLLVLILTGNTKLIVLANRYPDIPPINSEGANIPPLPPGKSHFGMHLTE